MRDKTPRFISGLLIASAACLVSACASEEFERYDPDGSTANTDGTSTDAPVDSGSLCGNDELDEGEECDDGNRVDADGCEADCTLPACENGIYDPGELCWPSAVSLHGTATPPELVVARLDGNARDDLAFLHEGELYVLLGRTDDTFQAKTPTALGTTASKGALAFGDLNMEGQQDVVVTDPDNDKIFLANGLGDGTFGDATTETTAVDLGDGTLTPFGIRQFVLVNFDEADEYPELFFFFGDDSWGIPPGPGYVQCPLCEWFAWEATGATVSGPSNPITGDFNADGHPDRGNYVASLVVALWMRTSNADGTFAWLRGEDAPGNVHPSRIVVGDVNGDGADDVASMYTSRLWVVPGVPVETEAGPPFDIVASYDMNDVTLADVDEDGDIDALACVATQGFLLLRNDGAGTYSEELLDGPSCDRIVAADFNGDAHVDLGVRLTTGGVKVYHHKP